MHSLTIVFGPVGAGTQFLFKERADAEKALLSLKSEVADFVSIKDDFGKHGEYRASTIHAREIDDLASEAVIERTLQNAKQQIKAQNRAGNDPTLKFAAANAPLNHPGMPNGSRRAY